MDLKLLGFDPGSLFPSFADLVVEATAVKVPLFLGNNTFPSLPWKPVMENKANGRVAFTSHRQIYEGAVGVNVVISTATAPAGPHWPAGGIRGRKEDPETGVMGGRTAAAQLQT